MAKLLTSRTDPTVQVGDFFGGKKVVALIAGKPVFDDETPDLSLYAKKTDIAQNSDTSNFATKAELNALSAKVTPPPPTALAATPVAPVSIAPPTPPPPLVFDTNSAGVADPIFNTGWVQTFTTTGGELRNGDNDGILARIEFTDTGYVFSYQGIYDAVTSLRWTVVEVNPTTLATTSRSITPTSAALATSARTLSIDTVRVITPGTGGLTFTFNRPKVDTITDWTRTGQDTRTTLPIYLYETPGATCKVLWTKGDCYVQGWGVGGTWTVNAKSSAVATVAQQTFTSNSGFVLMEGTITQVTVKAPNNKTLVLNRPPARVTWTDCLEKPTPNDEFSEWETPTTYISASTCYTQWRNVANANEYIRATWAPNPMVEHVIGSTQQTVTWYRLSRADGSAVTAKTATTPTIYTAQQFALIEIYPNYGSQTTCPTFQGTLYLPIPLTLGEQALVPAIWNQFVEQKQLDATPAGKAIATLQSNLSSLSKIKLSYILAGTSASQAVALNGTVTVESVTKLVNPNSLADTSFVSGGRGVFPETGRVSINGVFFRATGSNTGVLGFSLVIYQGATTTERYRFLQAGTGLNEQAYPVRAGEVEVQAGDTIAYVCTNAMTVWKSLCSISIAYVNPVGGALIPASLVSVKTRKISISGATANGGLTSVDCFEGIAAPISLDLNRDTVVATASLSNGTISSIRDAIVNIVPGTVDGTLTITTKALPDVLTSAYLRLTADLTGTSLSGNLGGTWAAESGYTNTISQSASSAPGFILKAGRWYELEAHLYATGVDASEYLFINWYNVTDAADLPATQMGGAAYDQATAARETMSNVVKAWVKPTKDIEVRLRIQTWNGTFTLSAESTSRSTSLWCKELPQYVTPALPVSGYSTTEQLTGRTWTDGKPTYIRTFTGTTPANGTDTRVLQVTGSTKIVNWVGYVYSLSLNRQAFMPGMYSGDSAHGPQYQFYNSTDLNSYYTYTDTRWNSRPFEITVEYTK